MKLGVRSGGDLPHTIYETVSQWPFFSFIGIASNEYKASMPLRPGLIKAEEFAHELRASIWS
jgi:hypothetical protein